MDINTNIKKSKPKKEVKPEKIFELQAEVSQIDEENFNFKAHVEASKMDVDLAASIFKELFEKIVSEEKRCEVLNKTAIKLGLRADEKDCKPEVSVKRISTEDFIKFLNEIIGD